MAADAALKAIASAKIEAADIELIICATVTPDTIFPATACYIQQKIGANRAAAFDISAACSGFLLESSLPNNLSSPASTKPYSSSAPRNFPPSSIGRIATHASSLRWGRRCDPAPQRRQRRNFIQ